MRNTRFVIAALCTGVLVCAVSALAQDAQQGAPQQLHTPQEPQPQPGDADVRERIDALGKLVDAQRTELERQKAELASYRERLDAAEASAALNVGSEATDVIDMAFEPSLKLYGFLDAGLTRVWGGLFDTGLALSDAGSFVLGNVNVYFDAQPAEQWRALVEVRFTTFPDGAEAYSGASGTTERVNTTTLDHTSAAGGFLSVRWGAIILERAHADYMISDAFNLRVGYFLTPYGIWNVDHGSPTRIMVRPPFFVSLQVIPERQTGVEIYGRFHPLPWELGYHLYVSNGRTFAGVDFDDDKALGGRIYARTRRPIGITLGVSFFMGSTEQIEKSVDLARGVIARSETIAFDEVDLGVDASLDVGPLRLRIEGVTRRQVYVDGKREITFGSPRSDQFNGGAFFLAAYRLPFLGLEPFTQFEIIYFPIPALGEFFLTGGGGIAVYLSPVATWRTQYDYAKSMDLSGNVDRSDAYIHLFSSRLSVAF